MAYNVPVEVTTTEEVVGADGNTITKTKTSFQFQTETKNSFLLEPRAVIRFARPAEKVGRPQNQWVRTFDIAPRQRVGFFALLKKQADMLERSQGLPKQPLACFLTPLALELVPTRALSSTEATL